MDRLFLITEVHYVTDVKIHLIIGDNEDEFQLRGRIPIGFSLVRYKLDDHGLLGDKKNVKVANWKAHWIRHQFREKDDPLPFDPFHKGIKHINIIIISHFFRSLLLTVAAWYLINAQFPSQLKTRRTTGPDTAHLGILL